MSKHAAWAALVEGAVLCTQYQVGADLVVLTADCHFCLANFYHVNVLPSRWLPLVLAHLLRVYLPNSDCGA